MFKLIGIYLDLNQKKYVDLVLDQCVNVPERSSQSSVDNELCTRYGVTSYPAFILLKNDGLCRKVIGKYPINVVKSKLLV